MALLLFAIQRLAAAARGRNFPSFENLSVSRDEPPSRYSTDAAPNGDPLQVPPSCCLVQHMGLQIVTELKVERNNRSFSRITSSPDVHCISSSSHKWPSHCGIAAAHNALNGYLPIVSDGQRTLDSVNFVSCHELMKRLNHSLDFTQGPPCSPLECASRPAGSKRENRLCWELAVGPIWHLPLVSYP